jgi:hypothetical protein
MPTNPKSRSRKRSKPRRLPSGRGAKKLRDSVNNIVGRESDVVAQTLFDQTRKGNMTAANFLIKLAGADKSPAADDDEHSPRKKKDNWAQLLVLEQECEDAKKAEAREKAEREARLQEQLNPHLPFPAP